MAHSKTAPAVLRADHPDESRTGEQSAHRMRDEYPEFVPHALALALEQLVTPLRMSLTKERAQLLAATAGFAHGLGHRFDPEPAG